MIPAHAINADRVCWKMAGSPTFGRMPEPTKCELWPLSHTPQAGEVVYISGPVTGIPKANRPQFLLAELMLLSYGCETFNPIHIIIPDPLEGEALWSYCMHFCVRALPECNSILMLPHWQNSKGAVWEKRIAEMLGLNIYYCPVPDHQPT